MKIGNNIDFLLKAEINEVHIKGKIQFSNTIYDFSYSNLSDQISSNLYGRNIIVDNWDQYEKIKNSIELKWGDIKNNYNCKVLIIKECNKYSVFALIFKKNDKSLFCCLSYNSVNLLDINKQCYSNWFYPVGNTISKFINMNLDNNNKIKLDSLYNKLKSIDFNLLALTEKENLIIFDIETNSFCSNFIKYQKLNDEKIKLYYPDIRVICCICIKNNQVYEKSFYNQDVKDFVKLIRQFDKVISFNGIHFDLPVIQKQLAYKNPIKFSGTHFDILEELYIKTGKRFSLDLLVRLNLAEKKMVKGRDMKLLSLDQLTKACFSDVRHTYLIYRLLKSKSLIIPKNSSKYNELPENYYQLPVSKKSYCNSCGNEETYRIENLKYNEDQESIYNLIACINCLEIRIIKDSLDSL